MTRKLMWAVLAIGVALIAAPFVMGLPDKASGGQEMIDAFGPIMDQDNVDTTADYYYDVFVPLGDVVPAMSQENIDKFNGYLAGFGALGVDAEKMVPTLAGDGHARSRRAGVHRERSSRRCRRRCRVCRRWSRTSTALSA